MSLSDFLRQFADAADKYLDAHEWRQRRSTILKPETDAMRALAEQVEGVQMAVTLEPDFSEELYIIKKSPIEIPKP